MFETLFSAETPPAVRFFLAFFVMLGLIGTVAWAVHRFATARLGSENSRGPGPRLAVIDTASVDERRHLILIRRDNVEHLLMIGGSTDTVVEPNIVRTVAAPREVVASSLPARAEPHNIAELDKRLLPQQPEAAGTPRLALQTKPTPEAPASWAPGSDAELFARAQHGALAVLADQLLNRRLDRGGLPGNDRAYPRLPVELAAVNSASFNPNLAKLAHHLEAALRMANMPAERREAYTPTMPAGAASQVAEHAAAALPQTQARAGRMAEPKSKHAEANPSQAALPYERDSLALGMANLIRRRIS
jgi:flagellar biogenesis protein FliO